MNIMITTNHSSAMKKDISKKQNRYRLYNSITGKEIASADEITAFREVFSEQEAKFLTVFDVKRNVYSGASIIFKDAKLEH